MEMTTVRKNSLALHDDQLCKYCGVTLPIMTIFSEGTVFYAQCNCSEAVAQREREDAARQEQTKILRQHEEQRRLARRIADSGVPARYRDGVLSGFDFSDNDKSRKTATDYVTNFSTNAKEGRGLLLIGDVGRGKTRLATIIALHAMQSGYSAKYVAMASLFDRLKSEFGGIGGDILNSIFATGLLVLDDIGKENTTSWSESVLFQIINHRYERLQPTIITTNLGIENIQARYRQCGDAIVSRLFETCTGIMLTGPDRRMEPTR